MRQLRDDGVKLWAVTHLGQELPPVPAQSPAQDVGVPLGRSLVPGQHPECCCLPFEQLPL